MVLKTNGNYFPIRPSINGVYNETEYVYCAVRTESLNTVQVNLNLDGTCHGSGSSSPASHRGGPVSIPGQYVWVLVMEKVTLRQVLLLVLRFCPFNVIPPVLHTHLQLHVAFTRTKGRNQGNTAKSNALSNIEEHWIENNFHVIFITAKARAWSLFSLCEILMGEVALERVYLRVLRFSPAIVVSAMLHTYLHSHVTLSRRTTDSLRTFQKVMLFRKSVIVCYNFCSQGKWN